jgi:hypothetical protein
MKDLTMDKTPNTFDSVLLIGGLVVFSIVLVWATEGYRRDYDLREQIGFELCNTNNLIYVRLNSIPQTIVCKTNISLASEHYNISPESLEITITPDWGYYLNQTKKGD